jgi:diacylglycerol kinase (ATP)
MRNTYFGKRIRSFGFAFNGIFILLKNEPNARIHIIAAILVIFAGVFFRISNPEWMAVAICIGCVLGAEAFNSAIEDLVDLVSPDRSPKAGRIKDLAAGAVLVVSISAFAVGVIVFLPYVLKLLL